VPKIFVAGDRPVGHLHHQISQAQCETRVPTHAQNDDLSVEVPSFEQIFDRDEPLHLFIIARHPRVCTRAVTYGVPPKDWINKLAPPAWFAARHTSLIREPITSR